MKSKLLICTAAAGAIGLFAAAPAGASEQRADGARNTELAQWEFSDHRRRYRHRHRHWGPRAYYYGGPYYAYAPRPYYYRPYYRPYYHRPGVTFQFGF